MDKRSRTGARFARENREWEDVASFGSEGQDGWSGCKGGRTSVVGRAEKVGEQALLVGLQGGRICVVGHCDVFSAFCYSKG